MFYYGMEHEISASRGQARTRITSFYRLIALICCFLAFVGSVQADTITATWTGGASSEYWFTPDNWDSAVYPKNTSADTYQVIIGAGNNVTTTYIGTTYVDNLNLGSGSNLTIAQNTSLGILGDSVNNGYISINDTNASSSVNSYFRLNGSAEISGTGSISFDTGYINRIENIDASGVLTMGSGQLLTTGGSGTAGTVTTDYINNGTVDSDGGYITFSSIDLTNNNQITSSNGGTVKIYYSTTDNSSGTITAEAGSSVRVDYGSLTGGTIDGAGSLYVDYTVTFTDVDLEVADTYIMQSDNMKVGGSLTNNSRIHLANENTSSSVHTNLTTVGNLTLDGTGQILFDTANYNHIGYSATTDRLTIGSGQTIKTTGTGSKGIISTGFINNGVINADNGTITLQSIAKTNNNLITATNGGSMSIAVDVDNTNGVISADDASTVTVVNSDITGGTINGDGSLIVDATSNFYSITLDVEDTYIYTNDSMRVNSSLINNSTIHLTDTSVSTSDSAILYTIDDVSLDGIGEILFETVNQNYITTNSSAGVLTIGSGQTIKTSGAGSKGTIFSRFTNNGVINADNGTITLSSYSKTNDNLISATNGGSLLINTNVDNTNGVISADASSSMTVSSVDIIGGTVTGAGSMEVNGSCDFDAVTLDIDDTYIYTGDSMIIKNSLVNNSKIHLDDTSGSTSDYSRLYVFGDISLSGNGEIIFDSANQNYIMNNSSTDVLTIGSGQTIKTSGAGSKGSIFSNFTNNGVINADNGTITLTSYAKTNNNLISATNGGAIFISSISVDNTNGTFFVDDTSTMTLNSVRMNGGLIDGTGYVHADGVTYLTDVALGNLDIETFTGDSLHLSGNITNNGTITINDIGLSTSDTSRLMYDDNVVIDGTGSIVFGSGNQNNLYGGASLTLGSGQTLEVASGNKGRVYGTVINQGTTTGGGTLIMDSAAVSFTNAGVMAPGDGVGTMAFNGNYIQADTGVLQIELAGLLAGEYDVLDISMGATLDGVLDIVLTGGFTPEVGDTFQVLFADSGITDLGLSLAANDAPYWEIGYVSGYILQLTVIAEIPETPASEVPEPGSVLLLLVGLGSVFAFRRFGKSRKNTA